MSSRVIAITITSPSDPLNSSDTTLNYHNFGEGIKQWTNVFGYSQTPTSTQQNSPLSGWTRTTYGPNFQAISAAGVDHNIPVQANDVLNWFGITGGGNPSTTSNPPPGTTTTTANGATQTHWGQCGGCAAFLDSGLTIAKLTRTSLIDRDGLGLPSVLLLTLARLSINGILRSVYQFGLFFRMETDCGYSACERSMIPRST